ncbi:hypothetical protein E4T56_gene8240 [Termitomyces sp. T112]|nr:hypothetical protein E4T56_gene8240 [Termitomyces sp. T112]
MVDSIQNQLKISSLPIQPASSSSSFPPVLASTLAPIAEAEEPNKDKAAEPKEDVSKMDKSTTVALSTISDNSAPISNPISSTTNSGIPMPLALSLPLDPLLVTNLLPTGVATNKPAIPSESTLVAPIAATGQLMDVDTTAPAPPHAPNEIALQCGHSTSYAT